MSYYTVPLPNMNTINQAMSELWLKLCEQQNGCQSAILDHMTKEIDVNILGIMYYAYTKYERNQSSNV